MGLLSWIVVGLLAGAIAKMLLPGKDPKGCLVTMGIGIAGALIGGFLATRMGYGGVTGVNFGSLVTAVLGAILFLLLLRALRGPR
ncbi:MAG: GlsB/YeaQ/YmgE family stress response membrane protein [Gammaproteobacteria bacterium]